MSDHSDTELSAHSVEDHEAHFRESSTTASLVQLAELGKSSAGGDAGPRKKLKGIARFRSAGKSSKCTVQSTWYSGAC